MEEEDYGLEDEDMINIVDCIAMEMLNVITKNFIFMRKYCDISTNHMNESVELVLKINGDAIENNDNAYFRLQPKADRSVRGLIGIASGSGRGPKTIKELLFMKLYNEKLLIDEFIDTFGKSEEEIKEYKRDKKKDWVEVAGKKIRRVPVERAYSNLESLVDAFQKFVFGYGIENGFRQWSVKNGQEGELSEG